VKLLPWWRSLTWPRRVAVAAAMTVSAFLSMLAWALSPAAALVTYITVAVSAAAMAAVRAAASRGR
jgi:hypothetical protein